MKASLGVPRQRPRWSPLAVTVGLVVVTLLPPPPFVAAAAARIRLSRTVGPPTTRTTVSGIDFGASERVEIMFDSRAVGEAATDPQGRFSKQIRVPASALPGSHTVTATGLDSGLSASAPFTVRTDWTKFHFDLANTGLNPYENVLGPPTVGGLAPDWERQFPALSGIASSPAVMDGIVYFGVSSAAPGQSDVMALDASTGDTVWRHRVGGLAAFDPTVARGLVYISVDATLRAYEARSGSLRWAFNGPGYLHTPVVAVDVLYVVANSGVLYALDPDTGEKFWEAWAGGPILGDTPALAAGFVYIGADDNNLYAFDADDGSIIWTAPTGGDIVSSPTVSRGTVFVGSNDYSVYAFNALTGERRWVAPTGLNVQSSPAVAKNTVYVGSADGSIYAFATATGAEVWRVGTGDAVTADPSIANGVVYVGSQDQVMYGIKADTGEVLWTWTTEGIIGGAPAVADGRVYIGSLHESHFYAFHLPATSE